MPVSTTHPEYLEHLPEWEKMRDALRGEHAIKGAGVTYLPKTDGQLMLERRGDIEGGIDPREFYRSYQKRAMYPLWAKDAVRSMMGMVSRQEPEIQLPSRMSGLKDNATVDGFGLVQLWLRIVREILITGRCPLVGDIDDTGKPYIANYRPESAINWKTADIDGRKDLILAVFVENRQADLADEFSHEKQKVYRVFDINEGRLRVRVIKDDGSEVEEERYPGLYSGDIQDVPVNWLPVIFAGSTDNAPDVDEVPLLTMANAALKYYQLSADYFEALHKTAFPQAWCATSSDFQIDLAGPGTMWQVAADGKFGYLEISGTGLEETRTSMSEQRSSALEAGARVMDVSGTESGDARKARQNDQYATLYSIAITAAESVQEMCRNLALMLNEDPDKVVFNVKPDFSDAEVNAQMAAQLLQAAMAGYISSESYWQYISTGKLPDRPWEQESAQIEGAIDQEAE